MTTIRERILWVLTEIAEQMTAATITETLCNVKLDSVSSILKKMVDNGELVRVEGAGPRGGYGYRLPPK